MHHWVMSLPRQQGMNPVIEMSDIAKKPTGGQQNGWTRNVLSEGSQFDDGMLKQGHRRNSVSSEMGQGELMGSIHCTRIPFILVAINQSHLLPLLRSYSTNPLVDPKTHFGTSTDELFFVMILTTPPMLTHLGSMLSFSLSQSCLIAPSFCDHDVSAYCQPHSGSAAYTLPIVIYF